MFLLLLSFFHFFLGTKQTTAWDSSPSASNCATIMSTSTDERWLPCNCRLALLDWGSSCHGNQRKTMGSQSNGAKLCPAQETKAHTQTPATPPNETYSVPPTPAAGWKWPFASALYLLPSTSYLGSLSATGEGDMLMGDVGSEDELFLAFLAARFTLSVCLASLRPSFSLSEINLRKS